MSNNDFRRARWGMSEADVRASEHAPLGEQDDGALGRTDIVAGRECFVFFNFNAARVLVSGSYVFDSVDDVDDIQTYENLKESLTAKYGEPSDDQVIWANPYDKARLSTYGDVADAVAAGRVKLVTSWATASTRIGLLCTDQSDIYNAMVGVFYASIAHEVENERIQRQVGADLL